MKKNATGKIFTLKAYKVQHFDQDSLTEFVNGLSPTKVEELSVYYPIEVDDYQYRSKKKMRSKLYDLYKLGEEPIITIACNYTIEELKKIARKCVEDKLFAADICDSLKEI